MPKDAQSPSQHPGDPRALPSPLHHTASLEGCRAPGFLPLHVLLSREGLCLILGKPGAGGPTLCWAKPRMNSPGLPLGDHLCFVPGWFFCVVFCCLSFCFSFCDFFCEADLKTIKVSLVTIERADFVEREGSRSTWPMDTGGSCSRGAFRRERETVGRVAWAWLGPAPCTAGPGYGACPPWPRTHEAHTPAPCQLIEDDLRPRRVAGSRATIAILAAPTPAEHTLC